MTRYKVNLFDLFRDSMMGKRKASVREQLDDFLVRVRADPRCLDALAEVYFYSQLRSWTVDETEHGATLIGTPEQKQRSERSKYRKEKSAAKTASVKDAMKSEIRRVILLDVTLPNGKLLRKSTFGDCAKAGGWLTAVSLKGNGNELVTKNLTEAQLQDIWSRYVSDRMRAA